MAETDAQILGRASPENMDPFAYAPPGHSLTQETRAGRGASRLGMRTQKLHSKKLSMAWRRIKRS